MRTALRDANFTDINAESFVAAENDVARLEGVGLQYGSGPQVLRDVSLRLEAGSFHFLTGETGAGKTSLLRLLYLERHPTGGAVFLFGEDVSRLRPRRRPALRRRIGVVSADFGLIDHLTTAENIALPLRLSNAREAKVREHMTELLRWVGLEQEMNELPQTLSEGKKQRAAIARAVVARPDLVLADEPTARVDDNTAMRLIHLLEELSNVGTTVVVATHDDTLVGRFGHPVYALDGGGIRLVHPFEDVGEQRAAG